MLALSIAGVSPGGVIDFADSIFGGGSGPGEDEAAASQSGLAGLDQGEADALLSEFGRSTVEKMAELGEGSIHKWCEGGRCSGSFGNYDGFLFQEMDGDLSRRGLTRGDMRRAGDLLGIPVGRDAIGEGIILVGKGAQKALQLSAGQVPTVTSASGPAAPTGDGGGILEQLYDAIVRPGIEEVERRAEGAAAGARVGAERQSLVRGALPWLAAGGLVLLVFAVRS